MTKAREFAHIPECDKNTDFTPASSEFRIDLSETGINKRAYSRHRGSMRYRDGAKTCINSWWAPAIKVMMIVLDLSSSVKGKIY
jgi:hypothetical protein